MVPIQKKLIGINYTKGIIIKPYYIVIHETANRDCGSNALANRNYFANHEEANASAHFIVDDSSIIQCLELNQKGWHVGDNKGYSNITNGNSIGIEICVNSDGNYDNARDNAIDLTKYLMTILKLSSNRVVRHYDASGKHCPAIMLDNPLLWNDFKAQIMGEQSNSNIDSPKDIATPISQIQSILNSRYGLSISVDGIFGKETLNAIVMGVQIELNKQFNKGLIVDGDFGSNTRNALVNVKNGASGNLTYLLQALLISKGYDLVADGKFGDITKEEVKKYQYKNGLVSDGIAGKDTWSSLLNIR